MSGQTHTLVIGAGIGGLTVGALLIQAGHRVTVLESQTYPGGSAGTFYHKKYLFDVGATLAGGFSKGQPHGHVGRLLNLQWPVKRVDPAWIVHLPGGSQIAQWSESQRWRDEWQDNFPNSASFWQKQQMLADLSWDLTSQLDRGSRPLPWPPQSAADYLSLAKAVHPSMLKALPYINRSMGSMAAFDDPQFKTFLDAQLLISAQTTAAKANALYGSAALDLPRRGVNYLYGGIGSLAKTIADWIESNGGQLIYRQKVRGIELRNSQTIGVYTEKGNFFPADNIIANLTPWSLANLLGGSRPPKLWRFTRQSPSTWGAFTLYLGLHKNSLPELKATHHQVIVDSSQPLGEGNSVFISLADPEDNQRGPAGYLPATLSTHTRVEPWWQLFNEDESAYFDRREIYSERLITAAQRAVPGIREAIDLALPGTPLTFEYYTGRPLGMVGGFPQTSLLSSLGPRTEIPNLYLVGDSIFPGQSTAGVTLGAMRTAAEVARRSKRFSIPTPDINAAVMVGE